jgi:hypothetical protein
MPWVALDCDATVDLELIIDSVRHSGDLPPYEQASTASKTLMETLARCHRVRDPVSGCPSCLGSLSTGNILFGNDGRLWIVGFGAGPLGGAVIAPEVAAGERPSPGSDVYSLIIFLRSQMAFVRMPSVGVRVFSGTSTRSDAKLVALLAWSNLRIVAGSPQSRPTMEETLANARKMWRLLGFEPDVPGFQERMKGAIAAERQRLAGTPRHALSPQIVIGRGFEWIETPNGKRHPLGRHGAMRRVVQALVHAHDGRDGAVLGVDQLLEAGWPGERPLPEAGKNRVWVAISTLRKLGLGDALQRWDGGYRLDPAIPCRIEGSGRGG